MTATTIEAPGHSFELPEFEDAKGWLAVASGLATLGIATEEGPAGGALCLDYDFGTGGGFVVARREIDVDFPDAWEARLFVRGAGPANTIEVKLVDAAGTSVWRWTREAFDTPDWTELAIPSRDFVFAWGPAGGGAVDMVSAIEIAVVAGPGGAGSLDISGFRVLDQSPGLGARIEASSSRKDFEPELAFDSEPSSSWRSREGAGPHSLTVHFTAMRDIGGVVVAWLPEARPESFRIELATGEDVWTTAFQSAARAPCTSHILLDASVRAQGLRIVATARDAATGVGVVQIDVRPVEWARTKSEFLTNVALRSRRGAWPRYLIREQSYWTPVATPTGGPVGLLSDDGAVEVGEAGFMIEPSLLLTRANGRDVEPDKAWLTWADVHRGAALEESPLPIATVTWRTLDPRVDEVSPDVVNLFLQVTAVAEDDVAEDRVAIRYRIANIAPSPLEAKLLVAVRPLQVTPPWQAYRMLGGPSPIRTLRWRNGRVEIDETASIAAASECTQSFGAAVFEEGGIAESLTTGVLPEHAFVEDARGLAEGVLAFDLVLETGAIREITVECTRPRPARKQSMGREPILVVDEAKRDAPARIAYAYDEWERALPTPVATGPAGAVSALDAAATAIAHVIACRDGAALQPGPRRYARSWVRDGAIMAASLLRWGRPDVARSFAEWYAPFQREDGYVPCCVDRDGVDPLVEHDSHGQLVYAVAETYRFTRDREFIARLWPRCEKAALFIEEIRAGNSAGDPEGAEGVACRGLLPVSVSHEGYLSQPVHSYWDDFWALRGLRDAAFLSRELGDEAGAAKWDAAAIDLAQATRRSIEIVMRERNLETVPASVEWADFDPTAIAGAISLLDAADLFPQDALHRTFDVYMKGLRARNAGTTPWNNYSPYEVRIIAALVHLGRRADASELLHAMLAARRPTSWRQWPEIVWRDIESPAHIGDLPHCWIGAEYVFVLRTMFVYERESDGALVVGAGLRREWLDGPFPLDVKNLPTWFGTLGLSIRRDGDGYVVVVRGAKPPGGFVVMLPEGCTSRIEVEQ